jgi:hypothetical protein
MLVWPLLVGLALSAAPTAITSSTFHFVRETELTGSVEAGGVDGLLLIITSAEVESLEFELEVDAEGQDADLIVTTQINGEDVYWTGFAIGSDYLQINSTDEYLVDGMGLQRSFLALVVGTSMDTANYSLTVTAHAASQWAAESNHTLKTHMATRTNDALFKVKNYKGDVTRHLKTMETGRSWLGVVGGVVLLGAGVCAWRKWGGRQGKNEDLAYRLI